MIEILESCPPTEELLSVVTRLHRMGYKIALDDFIPSKEWRPFLPYIALIKFDIRQYPMEKASLFIERLSTTDIRFLAEKVETYEEYEQARQSGFHYFQGYFFSKPQMLKRRKIEPSFLTVIQLCKEIARTDMDFQTIETLISSDLTLSYKLLAYVNSSSLVVARIQSFRQALVYLGEQRLRKFISLVAIVSAKEHKPDYLYTLSIQRARFCEQLSVYIKPYSAEPGAAFLTGMFSLLDSLLDQPLETIVAHIPIDEPIKRALTEGEGVLGSILALNKAYELADWDKVKKYSADLSLNEADIANCYEESLIWTEELLNT